VRTPERTSSRTSANGAPDPARPLLAGSAAPDLELLDSDGNPRRLSRLVGGDPTLLHFYRGWFCPKERAFFRRLLALQDEAEVAYTRFVSVSVEPPEVTSAFRAGLDARWTFLCDPERRYLDALGLRESSDEEHHPYLPTCAVLRPDLTVHSLYQGYWFWGRPTAEELRQDFREVTRAIRPDWDPPP
jgi:peroxiredoxin